jgi:hypothetical protein
VAFWLWAGLYFTTPFLVWGVWAVNSRRGTAPGPDDVMLPPVARLVMGATGASPSAPPPVSAGLTGSPSP